MNQQLKVEVNDAPTLLAFVTAALGFQPERSLVLLALEPSSHRVAATFRYDIPDDEDAAPAPELGEFLLKRTDLVERTCDIAAHMEAVMEREQWRDAILVGYGPADPFSNVVITAAMHLIRDGINLVEALRLHDGRYWSEPPCGDDCCPMEGKPLPDLSSLPEARQITDFLGPVAETREELAASLEPLPSDADRVRRTAAAVEDLLERITERPMGDIAAIRIGRARMRRAIRRYRRGGSLSSRELTYLAVLLRYLPVRDDAWSRMNPAYKERHVQLWKDMLRACPEPYAAAAGSLLAFCAWQIGNGGLARMAIDKALRADEHYSMATLIDEALNNCVAPRMARLPMSPAQVAASYTPKAEAET